MSVAEALEKPTTKQPVLFELQDTYYVKVDGTAIAVTSASGFYDAVEFLMSIFYVFDVSYEHDLKPTFGFLEKVLKILMSIGRSSAVSDLWRAIGGN